MCLELLHNHKFPGKRGWKFVEEVLPERYFTGFNDAKVIVLTKKKFTRASTEQLNRSGVTYPGGFHIFTSKESAKLALKMTGEPFKFKLCKVEFKKQVAYGTVFWSEGFHPKTVVAQYCKIIESD